MSEMRNVSPEKKKEMGIVLNDLKLFAENKHEELKKASGNRQQATENIIDLTLPGDSLLVGSRHPISIVRNKIVSIFQRLGFAVAEGPEIEDDWHNFTALNLPENHPARDMQDTFYINENPVWLLRTPVSYTHLRAHETGRNLV